MGSEGLRERYVNPYTDFAFKLLFGTDLNKEILIGFLNALFNGEQIIEDVTYLNTEHLGSREPERRAVFDVYCQNEKGEKILILKNLSRLMERPTALQERVFNRLFEAAEIAQFSSENLYAYEESLKVYRDWNNVIDTAIQKGEEKGREKGRAEGRAEGKAEGRAEGELKKAKAIARNLKKAGLPIAEIATATGLSTDEISSL